MIVEINPEQFEGLVWCLKAIVITLGVIALVLVVEGNSKHD